MLERVNIKIGMHTLQNGGDSLQPHTSINRRLFQINSGTVRQIFKLVKHQIPNLNKTVAVFFRCSRQPAPDFRSVVVKNLRAGTAGAGVAHLPEVVFGGNADNPLVGQRRYFLPDVISLVVGMENRNRQLFFRNHKFFRQQFPGIINCLFLKIIAEREVAEHFKKRMVAHIIADAVQIIVLAACAYAFLGSCGSRIISGFVACQNVFELYHA